MSISTYSWSTDGAISYWLFLLIRSVLKIVVMTRQEAEGSYAEGKSFLGNFTFRYIVRFFCTVLLSYSYAFPLYLPRQSRTAPLMDVAIHILAFIRLFIAHPMLIPGIYIYVFKFF
ncbi:hypothetical protein CEN48_08715 [Fischerella thermalis CCMEE 5282]|nr:hypothetical protein CEN48_08715 [Fischerella thermalis CCMEE 5282]